MVSDRLIWYTPVYRREFANQKLKQKSIALPRSAHLKKTPYKGAKNSFLRKEQINHIKNERTLTGSSENISSRFTPTQLSSDDYIRYHGSDL